MAEIFVFVVKPKEKRRFHVTAITLLHIYKKKFNDTCCYARVSCTSITNLHPLIELLVWKQSKF